MPPPQAVSPVNPSSPVRKVSRSRGERTPWGWGRWLADPRGMVLVALGSALVFGGGRRWLMAIRSRRAIAAIAAPRPTPEEVEAAADHGRAGLMDLFRLLGTSDDPAIRDAAGHALAALWKRDDLIAEEEKALVRRGFDVAWRARKRYPRGLKAPIPVGVAYGVPFLRPDRAEVGPDDLSWSHRITGAERAGLEVPSSPIAGPGSFTFAIDPGDFPANGPHRLVLHARVHAAGPTSSWDLDLPQMPFTFEFDPRLAVDALFALPDEVEAARIASAVRLVSPVASEDEAGPTYLDLGPDLVLRDPPVLEVATPLPRDLAHAVAIEFEGVPGRFRAGSVVASGPGASASSAPGRLRIPLGPIIGIPADAFDRPGEIRLRAHLTADADLGWADPDVRSLWPGTITTDWTTARAIRR
ncbi:hypothetical protein TA3x_000813 [Tundrisphaera sp. TA3]|uniref:hypothetical protein n=1 Tax=Tundrisphaera sp. TA3 TaxID=3435775 RepID=UPI003EB76C44